MCDSLYLHSESPPITISQNRKQPFCLITGLAKTISFIWRNKHPHLINFAASSLGLLALVIFFPLKQQTINKQQNRWVSIIFKTYKHFQTSSTEIFQITRSANKECKQTDQSNYNYNIQTISKLLCFSKNTLLIILIMSNQGNQIKIQVRLGVCTLKSIAAPSQYSFTLSKDRVISPHSPWKHPNENIVNFNSFLRIKVDECDQNSKCVLSLYSRSEDRIFLLGSATISLSLNKCGKVRKYPVKKDGSVIANIDASLYLFCFDHSMPLFQKNLNSITSQLHYSACNQYQSKFDNVLRRQETFQKQNKDKCIVNRAEKLSINKLINLAIIQEAQKPKIADNLFTKLFQEIGKKDQQIDKRKAELEYKDSLLQHIKVKQILFQQESKRINRLKHDAQFLIEANEELIHNDDRYDENYYKMKEEKQEMQQKMAIINSQASLKLMCLKSQLQCTNKQLDKRQVKIQMLINQIQSSTKTLNNLKHENRQKAKIIENLKSEFKHSPSNTNTQNHQEKKGGIMNIFQILTQQFDSKKHDSVENVQTLPSIFQQQAKLLRLKSLSPQKRCKTLSIAKPNNSKQTRSFSKLRFRASKVDVPESKIQIPSMIQYIMNLSSNVKDKIGII